MKMERWTAERGLQVVRDWRASGLSMAAYSRQRGFKPQRLLYWRQQVERQEAARQERPLDGHGAEAQSVALVPGVLVGQSMGVRVRLAPGLEVWAGETSQLPVQWVAELVQALEVG